MIRPRTVRTRQQQNALKKKGDIRGYFPLPRGRPPKDKNMVVVEPLPASLSARGAYQVTPGTEISSLTTSTGLAAATTTSISAAPISKKRGPYRRYAEEDNYKIITKALKIGKLKLVTVICF
jgi:hypothetical protein